MEQLLQLTDLKEPTIIETGDWRPSKEQVQKLTRSFINRYISYKNGHNRFWVIPGLTTSGILNKKEPILSAAKLFRSTATALMDKLAERYKVDFKSGQGLYELRTNNDHIHRVDRINDQWKFQFHGYECRLTNEVTGQSLDTIFIHRPEFGVLDPYFFLQYVNTTPELRDLKVFFNDKYDYVDQALLTLEAHGEIKRFPKSDVPYSSRGLIVY
ncbi:MAG: hypothetical protein Roseis2KO_55730 [Roseivirga sp.]